MDLLNFVICLLIVMIAWKSGYKAGEKGSPAPSNDDKGYLAFIVDFEKNTYIATKLDTKEFLASSSSLEDLSQKVQDVRPGYAYYIPVTTIKKDFST